MRCINLRLTYLLTYEAPRGLSATAELLDWYGIVVFNVPLDIIGNFGHVS